jgi:hypothetical protein
MQFGDNDDRTRKRKSYSNVDKQELGKIINPLDAAMPQPKAK